MFDIQNFELLFERAQEHIDSLDKEINLFLQGNRFVGTLEEHHQEARYIVRYRKPAPPGRLGILLAESINCIRFSLDHLAWQLALLTKSNPYEFTGFPILKREPADDCAIEAWKDIPPAARTLIRCFQPYHRKGEYKTHPLWVLNRVCNTSKHRVIPTRLDRLDFKVPKDFASAPEIQTDGDTITVVLPLGGPIEFEPRFSAGVVFAVRDETDVIGFDISRVRQIHRFVRNDVIPQFTVFFTQ